MEHLIDAPARPVTGALELWNELKPYRFEDRLHLVRTHGRFVTREMCELLCQESARLTAIEPERAIEAAELAVVVADLVKGVKGTDDCRECYQLRGYAWAHDGNARRVLGDLRNAEESFTIACDWWEAGTAGIGDLFAYEPVILEHKASLQIAQRRFPEAFETLDRMFTLYREGRRAELRDDHLAGRALIKKAIGLIEMGCSERAIGVLQQADKLVDARRDARLYLCLRHNLLCCFANVEEHGAALAMLPEVTALCREIGNPIDLLRLRWVEGQIAAARGRTDEAMALFDELRQEFAERNLAYDAALVTLELTALYARSGAVAEVKTLSLEMSRIFQAQDVPREALAALLFFQKAAERELATAKLAREIGVFLEKLRNDPGLRFAAR
jgi:tetratricopeptide (TPR) repeat protein